MINLWLFIIAKLSAVVYNAKIYHRHKALKKTAIYLSSQLM